MDFLTQMIENMEWALTRNKKKNQTTKEWRAAANQTDCIKLYNTDF